MFGINKARKEAREKAYEALLIENEETTATDHYRSTRSASIAIHND